MMNLAGALWSARTALDAAAAQTAIASRNIANAGNEDASRKTGQLSNTGQGAQLVLITRAESGGLRERALSALSAEGRDTAMLDLMGQVRAAFGNEDYDTTPAARLAAMRDALAISANDPSNRLMAERAIGAAKDLAGSVRDGAAALAGQRKLADDAIVAGVERLNGLLARFETVNNAVVSAVRGGLDATDAQDERDRLVGDIAGLIGVKTIARAKGDMLLQTESGAILFEGRPRTVSLSNAGNPAPGQPGSVILVDGLSVAGPDARMPVSSGSLKGLVDFRDGVALDLQKHFDELARGLIVAFADKDRSAVPTLPDLPGLFTATGLTSVPGTPNWIPGLASLLTVNGSVDPAVGGDPSLLRDGGIGAPGNPAYAANATGAAGFDGRLKEMLSALDLDLGFDTVNGLPAQDSLTDAARISVAWFEDRRAGASQQAGFSTALLQRARDALSAGTGINLDQEMSRLLELERSYGASARLISAVDSMFDQLLAAVR